MPQERSSASLRGFASRMSTSSAKLPERAVPTSLMKSEVSRRTETLPSMRDAKVVARSRQSRVVFPLTGIWHPKPVAKAVERRKASVDDA